MIPINWSNLLTYCLQVGLLVGLVGWIPRAARLRSPKARLAFFHAVLAACLLLPAMRPWKSETIAVEPQVAVQQVSDGITAPLVIHRSIDPYQIVLAILAIGILARFGMLALGLFRLRQYRLRSTPLPYRQLWGSEADFRISPDVHGPVTFGLLRPVILLPGQFQRMSAEMRDAILCHEILHVRRRDWLFTAVEEMIRAALWFHPAIWWLLGEIQLNREQAVDREAVELTNAREPYVDALLAAAGAPFEADLAPAPLFLRKRHLKQRVVSILKEKQMSKTRTLFTLAAGLALLAGAAWYVTGALPLSASPLMTPDDLGVTVDLMGSQVLHRSPVTYPLAAVEKNLAGVVVAQVKLDDNGNVTDATILSGPDGLRKPVLQSVLAWHFTRDEANSTRQISVKFTIPETSKEAPGAGVAGGVSGGVQGGVAGGVVAYRNGVPVAGRSESRTLTADGRTVTINTTKAPEAPAVNKTQLPMEKRTIRAISVTGFGLPDEDIVSKLPVRIGDTWSTELAQRLTEAAHQVDEHAGIGWRMNPDGETIDLEVRTPVRTAEVAPRVGPPPVVPGAIVVPGPVQAQKIISQTPPAYPQIAKQARVSGTVELAAVIAPDGHMRSLMVLSGHALLRQAALDAVKNWVYEPTLLNGQPVAISTTIDVIFTLSEN